MERLVARSRPPTRRDGARRVLLDDVRHAARILAALAAMADAAAELEADGPVLRALREELDLIRSRVMAGRLARHGSDRLGPPMVELGRDGWRRGRARDRGDGGEPPVPRIPGRASCRSSRPAWTRRRGSPRWPGYGVVSAAGHPERQAHAPIATSSRSRPACGGPHGSAPARSTPPAARASSRH